MHESEQRNLFSNRLGDSLALPKPPYTSDDLLAFCHRQFMTSIEKIERDIICPQSFCCIWDQLLLQYKCILPSADNEHFAVLQIFVRVSFFGRGILSGQTLADTSPVRVLVDDRAISKTGNEGLDETLVGANLPSLSQFDQFCNPRAWDMSTYHNISNGDTRSYPRKHGGLWYSSQFLFR